MKKFFVLACAAVAGASQAIVIDDFSTGNTGVSIQSGNTLGSQLGSMIGGERDAGIQVIANPLNMFLDLSINGGLNITSSGTLVQGNMVLDYDGIGDETDGNYPFSQGPGLGNVNLAAGADRFRLNFLANDLSLSVTATIFDYDTNTSSSLTQVVAGGASGDVDFMFSNFVGAAGFGGVDRIAFQFDMSPSGDFALNSIEAVPEPASMAVLCLGLAAIARRRRSNRK